MHKVTSITLYVILLIGYGYFAISSLENDWILNMPGHFKKYDGKIEFETHVTQEYININYPKFVDKNGWTDGEDIDAIEHFFWGSSNGLVMEMGAVDGRFLSQSIAFEKLGWNRILVEGNTFWTEKLKALNQNALIVNSAVCESEKDLHYVGKSSDAGVAGIVEFMSPRFLSFFHPQLLNFINSYGSIESVKNWSLYSNYEKDISLIKCIPLQYVFDTLNIFHINYFILDVEGGELSVLRSIDFTKVTFDVMTIEVEYGFRSETFVEDISTLLAAHGYRRVDISPLAGRNAWFVHKDYTPSSNNHTRLFPNCFKGSFKSMKRRGQTDLYGDLYRKYCV